MFFNITFMLVNASALNDTLALYLSMIVKITMCTMLPQFIISIRELYDRGLRHCWQGVDAGFGVLSQPNASQNAAVSAIEFADGALGEDQAVEGDANEPGAIRLETFGDNARQV